jgi:hypothetical protein
MSTTYYFLREKNEVSPIVMQPTQGAEPRRFCVWDVLLVAGFLTAFVGLVFLLAH